MLERNLEIKQDWWPYLYVRYCSSLEEANDVCNGNISINTKRFFDQRLDSMTSKMFLVQITSLKHVIFENEGIEDEDEIIDLVGARFPIMLGMPIIVTSFIGISNEDKIFNFKTVDASINFREDKEKDRAFNRNEEYCVIIDSEELDKKIMKKRLGSETVWGELDYLEPFVIQKKRVQINKSLLKGKTLNDTAYLGEYWLHLGLSFAPVKHIKLGKLDSALVMKTEEFRKIVF